MRYTLVYLAAMSETEEQSFIALTQVNLVLEDIQQTSAIFRSSIENLATPLLAYFGYCVLRWVFTKPLAIFFDVTLSF